MSNSSGFNSSDSHSLATADELVSSVRDMYIAAGPREKTSYRKGFQAGFDLAMEYWNNERPKEYAVHNAKVIMDIMMGINK